MMLAKIAVKPESLRTRGCGNLCPFCADCLFHVLGFNVLSFRIFKTTEVCSAARRLGYRPRARRPR